MAVAFTEIPAVDLRRFTEAASEAEAAAVGGELVEICHEVGFFLLTHHGVPDRVSGAFDTAMAAFFALPLTTKEAIAKHRSPLMRGWEAVGSERTGGRIDFREQLDLSTEHPPRPAGTMPPYLRLDGPNPWLPEAVLPGFRAAVTAYQQACGMLADTLLDALSLGFGLTRHHLRTAFGERPLSLLKLIDYPPTPAGEAGVNEHHDAGFLTLLRQHDVGGLQARNPDGAWVDVPVRADAFVVNLGEMLQEMSGNYVVAATHRVVAGQARRSSAYFHGPDLRTPLSPLTLDARFADAVAASDRHRRAGFMATAEQLAEGADGIDGNATGVYGQQLWNYYRRSYPALVAAHHPGC